MRTRLLLVLLSAVLVAACQSDAPQPPPEGPTYEVRGRYVSSAFEGQAVILDHEPIPGVMEAMRMSFRVHDPDAWEALPEGAPIVFTLIDAEVGYVVLRPQALPDTTTLDLP
ncbi:MAG: copper-binding protein [Bacteroidota bacterium]